MNRSNDNDLPKIAEAETLPDAPESSRPGPLTIIITLLVLLAMLTSLIWPLLYAGPRRASTPTPTPSFLQEVQTTEPVPTVRVEAVRINRALHQEGL